MKIFKPMEEQKDIFLFDGVLKGKLLWPCVFFEYALENKEIWYSLKTKNTMNSFLKFQRKQLCEVCEEQIKIYPSS